MREEIGKRVRALRESRGWSLAELAERVSGAMGRPVGTSQIQSWEVGRLQLWRHGHYVKAIASVFGIDPVSLLEGNSSISVRAPRPMRRIPVLGELWAGEPAAQTGDVEYMEVEDWGTDRSRWARRVSGMSMHPLIHPGDIAIFEERQAEPGNIVHAYDSGVDCIKVLKSVDGHATLESANPAHPGAPGCDWTIKGVLMEIRRDYGFGVEVSIRTNHGGPLFAHSIPKV